jgi:hypothetical protein
MANGLTKPARRNEGRPSSLCARLRTVPAPLSWAPYGALGLTMGRMLCRSANQRARQTRHLPHLCARKKEQPAKNGRAPAPRRLDWSPCAPRASHGLCRLSRRVQAKPAYVPGVSALEAAIVAALAMGSRDRLSLPLYVRFFSLAFAKSIFDPLLTAPPRLLAAVGAVGNRRELLERCPDRKPG